MTRTCAISSCSPMCFPWGFDEEDEGYAALKLILMNRITKLRGEGCTRFTFSMNCGVGLYAAENLHGLRGSDEELERSAMSPTRSRLPSGHRGCGIGISMLWPSARKS